MPAPECCILRAAFAAVGGGLVAFALLAKHGVLLAALVSPLIASGTVVTVAALSWLTGLIAPYPPAPARAFEQAP